MRPYPYILQCVFPKSRLILASGSSMYDAGNPKPVLCDNLEGWDGEGGGRGVQVGGNICVPNANSCQSLAKTITILKVIIF